MKKREKKISLVLGKENKIPLTPLYKGGNFYLGYPRFNIVIPVLSTVYQGRVYFKRFFILLKV